jgi:endonuclease-3 related protein
LRLSKLVEDLEDVKSLLPGYGWFPGPGDSLRWWAGYSDPFHIVVTAILVQMSRWDVVDRVFRRLLDLRLVEPKALASIDPGVLEELLKPLNFRRSKARTLIGVSKLLLEVDVSNLDVEDARRILLRVKGVGRETADSILLFAYNKPTIPISRQLRRMAWRYGVELPEGYEDARRLVLRELDYNLYKLKLLHASTTIIAREFCKVKSVKCSICPLSKGCHKRVYRPEVI